MLLAWNEKLGMSVRDLDKDHAKFIGITNKLQSAIDAVVATGEIDWRKVAMDLNDLEKLTRSHCEREELRFFQTGFPCEDSHRQEHLELIGKLRELTARFHAATDLKCATEVLQSIHDWIAAHISISDRKYGSRLSPLQFI